MSSAELWGLLVFNYETKSAYDVVSVVDMVRKVETATSLVCIQSHIASLERLYLEFARIQWKQPWGHKM